MDVLPETYLPTDQRFIDEIVRELKSQGIFDQFRKECISDVDTKPAYQNLRQRVENSVSGFLTKQNWTPDMNKNQVREMLRKNIYESGFFEIGVERVVDQVVNPKINTVFFSKVEDVVYKILGIEKPSRTEEKINATPKINTFHDIVKKDSKETPTETRGEIKEEDDNIKIEDESPAFETLEEKSVKDVTDENSLDSQFSVLSGITTNSHESNHSIKQDSVMSLNSSESRMSLAISESTSMMDNPSKIESDDVFISQKSSDSNSKQELIIAENSLAVVENEDTKLEIPDILTHTDENTKQNEAKTEKGFDESDGKSKNSTDKKRERYHSSSDRSKSRNDKDKSRSDKYKKEEKESGNEQKIDKGKYRIPRLSDKTKNDKDKTKDKDAKSKDKIEKDKSEKDKSEKDKCEKDKSGKDKKLEKEKKSSKHSSDKDKSKSERNKRDSKSDKKDKERDEKRDKTDKKESSRTDKSKDEKKSSSRKRDSSSSKDRHKDKDSNTKKSSEDMNKNGHVSTNSNTLKKDTSKPKKEDDKYKSSKKRDDKNDKDDKKRKRDSKDDHYSSKDKSNGRRSSDRDSDGPSNNKRMPLTPQKNSEKYSTQKSNQGSSCSNIESSSGDSGNSDKVEEKADLLLDVQKIKLPKFASNLQEAMKIMKIRKQLKKLENMNKLDPEHPETKKLMKDIASLTKDTKIDEPNVEEKQKVQEVEEVVEEKTGVINISDFISSSNISMAKWNALEAKFMEELGNIDYDSYESPYLDDEDSNSVDYSSTCGKIDKKIGKILQEPREKSSLAVVKNQENEVESLLTANEEADKKIKDCIVPNECHEEEKTSMSVDEDLPNISSEISGINDPENKAVRDSRWDKNDNFNKTAIIVLQKNPIAEEMIKSRKNGEHSKSRGTSNSMLGENALKNEVESSINQNTLNNCSDKQLLETIEKKICIKNEQALEEDCEHSCKGFEITQNSGNINNLNHLIKSFEENISEDVKRIGNLKARRRAIKLSQKQRHEPIETINNNLENLGAKGRKNKINLPTIKSVVTTRRKRTNDENVGIPNGFIHPLDSTENESAAEKINNPITVNTRSNEAFGNEETEDMDEIQTPNNKKLKVSGRNSTGRKSANQRYSSEDLYKPRMFLRRSAKHTKNP